MSPHLANGSIAETRKYTFGYNTVSHNDGCYYIYIFNALNLDLFCFFIHYICFVNNDNFYGAFYNYNVFFYFTCTLITNCTSICTLYILTMKENIIIMCYR